MPNRRQLLQGALAGAGLLGLRAMATGLPISFLLNPKSVRADDACANAAGTQFLILSMSASGDALNINVPGTYDLPATFAAGSINHAEPADMSMAATSLSLSGKKWTAAKPWASLPQGVLDRTCSFTTRPAPPTTASWAACCSCSGRCDVGNGCPRTSPRTWSRASIPCKRSR